MNALLRTLTLVLTGLVLALPPAQSAGIKKWVDENGITHYGTTIPPEYVDREHSELDERGIERHYFDRAPTAEEIERDKAIAALREEQRKLMEEQQERDRILLNLYRNEDDLVMARDGKIAQIDAHIRLTHEKIRRLKDRLSESQAKAAAAERSGKKISETQQASLDSTQRSIEASYASILAREDEKKATIERYDFDLQRFRKLRAGGARSENADLAKPDVPDLVDTAVRCKADLDCDRLWEVAQVYAREHATTPVDLAAERILVTAPPRELRDISVTVSRLSDDNGRGERIFMDIQCVNFTEGVEFCRGPDVGAIRQNFRVTLENAAAGR